MYGQDPLKTAVKVGIHVREGGEEGGEVLLSLRRFSSGKRCGGLFADERVCGRERMCVVGACTMMRERESARERVGESESEGGGEGEGVWV
jgi:hypothetical protein